MSSDTTTSRKKTTKGVVVPSRYKQAAQSANETCSREKSPQSRGTSSNRTEKPLLMSTMNSVSSEVSRYGSSKKFTSTPAIQSRCVLPPIDASTIADEKGFLGVPNRNMRNVANSTGKEQISAKNKTRSQSSKSNAPLRSTQKVIAESNSTSTVSQAELNCLYAEYLQAKLLESQAKETLQKRSADITEKIHQIWTLMQDLMVKNAKVYRELQLVSGLNRLHKHLQKQEEMLLPVLEMIPEFENQYESIAQAVDTVRHKLEIKNMSLPENGSEEVIQLLLQISNLIANLKTMHDSDKIILAAGVSDKFLHQAEYVSSEIKRAGNLLSEANDLLLDETSLKLIVD